MEEESFLESVHLFWNNGDGLAKSARGASSGIGTLWKKEAFDLIQSFSHTHWILSILHHKESGIQVSILNIYVPILMTEKRDYWQSIQEILSSQKLENIILVGDLNITLNSKEKKGGSIVRYPLREIVEDVMMDWDLEDIKPNRGNFTWTNRRIGLGHIAARLDRFLVQKPIVVIGFRS